MCCRKMQQLGILCNILGELQDSHIFLAQKALMYRCGDGSSTDQSAGWDLANDQEKSYQTGYTICHG